MSGLIIPMCAYFLLFSVVKGFQKQEFTDSAKRHIKAKSVAVSDGLACFRGFCDADVFHFTIVTGGGAECVENPYSVGEYND